MYLIGTMWIRTMCWNLIFISLTVALVSSQNIEWESTCVTDPNGQPRLYVENLSDGPIVFTIECANLMATVHTEPHTTRNILVHFPWSSYNAADCFLETDNLFVNSFFVEVFAYELEKDYVTDAFNITYCTTEPGVEDRSQVYSDCEVDIDGHVDYHYVNNMDSEIVASFVCVIVVWVNSNYNWVYDALTFFVPPRTRAVLSLQHYSPHDQFDGDQSCVLIPTIFEPFYFLNSVMMKPDLSFIVHQFVFCEKRTTETEPLAEVILTCPSTPEGSPELELRADIPAYVVIHCRNGDDHLSAFSRSSAELVATFNQSIYETACQFYKQENALTFSLTIEIGWGLQNREIFLDSKIQVLSCLYDDHGSSRSSVERVDRPYLVPESLSQLKGEPLAHGMFNIQVLDALDRAVSTGGMASGRLIRLSVTDTTNTLLGFRAHSCTAHNGVTSYTFLVNGCGDGLVLNKNRGFMTEGNTVFSPFFKVFKLRGGRNLWFDCLFTDCDGECDGSSCDWVGEFDDFYRFGDGDTILVPGINGNNGNLGH